MSHNPITCCPICLATMAYADRLQQHLAKDHADRQQNYAGLEQLPVNAIVLNKWGRIYQKDSDQEQCWATPDSVARFSTWQLMRGEAPIFELVRNA